MERSKQIAIQFFKSLGYRAEAIPESSESRADVVAHDGEYEYIIEVKDRIDDPETIANQLTTISDGENQLSVRISPLDRSNRLDGILKFSGNQLKETPSKDTAFRLIWLHCNGIDDELQEVRTRNTFYGIVPVVPKESGNGCMCLYFDFNTAYLLPYVNGLFIATNRGLRLYINEFAPTVDRFRISRLINQMSGAVFDPAEIVATKEHIAFKGNMSRKDESAVLDGLEKQTGIRYRTARLKRHSF
jgi:hypothetical protein